MYYDNNIEKIHLSNVTKYKKNKVEYSLYNKVYRESHKEDAQIYSIKYRNDNKEIIKIKKHSYYQDNKIEIEYHKKIYYFNNKDRLTKLRSIYSKKYKSNNKDKTNINTNKRRARKLKLISDLTLQQWKSIKTYFNNKCCYCGRILPLQQEHVIPVVMNGGYTLNNILCACGECNTSKGSKNFYEWYSTYKFYSKERLDKIKTWTRLL